MNFKETLEAVEKVSPSAVYDAMIANEVDFFFGEGGKENFKAGRERDDFEQLCELASTAYLKVDTTTSLSQIVDSLRRLVREGKEISFITHHDIIDGIIY